MTKDLLKMRRREFIRTSGAVVATALMPRLGLLEPHGASAAVPGTAHKTSGNNSIQQVRPIIGTGWRGHMFPGAVAPFGMVQLSPDTSGPPEPRWNSTGDWYGWEHCSGYHYPDNIILGFTHTHLQGTGGSDLGDILVMPIVDGKNWSWDPGIPDSASEMQIEALSPDSGIVFSGPNPGYRSFFSHDMETARPGYYGVHLQTPDVQADLTATTRCGMHRYRYPAVLPQARQGLIVDLAHGLGSRVYFAELKFETSSRITGKRCTHGWAADREAYFVMEFSRPVASMEVRVDGQVSTAAVRGHYSGQEVKAILQLAADPRPFLVRVGISPISIEGAAKNLASEIPSWDFDVVVRKTEQHWNEALAVLDADLTDQAQSETFYTAFYHSLVAPATFNDIDGTYRGQDRQNHPNPGFVKYTALSIWDIYRGEFPFISLMQPRRVNDIVRTLLLDYQQLGQHSLPMWPLWANETWSMVGFHAAGMILGAYVRGFRDFDVQAAYAAIRDTALIGAQTKGNSQLQAMFRQYGYVPLDLHEGGVSTTLDLSYDYWCAGAMAELLGKDDDAQMFFKLGQNYKNVFNPKTGFMQGKTKDGKWRDPFRPDQEYDDYVETDAWQSSFSVPHDVQGLIELFGGDEPFIAKLEGLFTAPSFVLNARPDITGMVGQDAQGNEPSNHNPYLFSFAGAAWKTQYWVRKVAALYSNTPNGIPGNDDCGQLSSWFVFASLGFYPMNAATGVYVIGSPLVHRAAIRNSSTDTTFTIVAENNSLDNVYIRSATLNGKELTRSWLTHGDIVAGGELHFRMGNRPNKEWASALTDRPPSGLIASM